MPISDYANIPAAPAAAATTRQQALETLVAAETARLDVLARDPADPDLPRVQAGAAAALVAAKRLVRRAGLTFASPVVVNARSGWYQRRLAELETEHRSHATAKTARDAALAETGADAMTTDERATAVAEAEASAAAVAVIAKAWTVTAAELAKLP